MCTKKFLYCRPSFLITNKKLFVSQELMPGYNIISKITHVAVNMGEFAFILKTLPFKLISTKYLQE